MLLWIKPLDKKLDFLENHKLINEYGLYTNFILADVDLVNRLKNLENSNFSLW